MDSVSERRRNRRDDVRLTLAFLILPPINFVVVFAGVWLLESGFGVFGGEPVDLALSLASGVAVAAVLVTLGGVLPIVLARLSHGPISLRELVITGAALGNTPLVLLAVLILVNLRQNPLTGFRPYGLISFIALGTALGALSAVIFWIVGLRGTGHVRPEPAG